MAPGSGAGPRWSRLDRRLTRRGLLGSGLALGMAAALAGCGGDDDDDATATSEPTGAADAGAEPTATEEAITADDGGAGFPVTITHALGETEIPARPERIVTTNDTEPLDCLLAMGVKPVLYGFTDGYQLGGLTPWVEEIGVEDVERYDNLTREPDVERIAAARPDLILDTWTPENLYQQLSGVAPTLVIKAADNTPWQDLQRMVGEATGYIEESEQAIAETEAVIAEQVERMRDYAGTTVAIAYQFFDELLINGKDVSIGRQLDQLGLTVLAPADEEITFLSLEQWVEVADADIIVSPEFFGDDITKQEANELFLSLEQVQSGRYVVLPNVISQATYLESALSIRWVMSRLADAVIEAIEGRGGVGKRVSSS